MLDIYRPSHTCDPITGDHVRFAKVWKKIKFATYLLLIFTDLPPPVLHDQNQPTTNFNRPQVYTATCDTNWRLEIMFSSGEYPAITHTHPADPPEVNSRVPGDAIFLPSPIDLRPTAYHEYVTRQWPSSTIRLIPAIFRDVHGSKWYWDTVVSAN